MERMKEVSIKSHQLTLSLDLARAGVVVQIEIRAQRNEILDQSSLILRYQAEIKALRAQLEEAAKGRGVGLSHDPLHPEVLLQPSLLAFTEQRPP